MTLRHQDSLATPRYGHSYSKAYPAQKPPSNPLLTIISCLLLLAALLLVVGVGGRALLVWQGRGVPLYAVVIDSGSSGTRIYAYNWTQPPPGSSFPLVQPIPPSAAAHLVPKHASKGMYSRVETRPGLDAFAANASGLSSALGPLLTWAQAVVPPGAHASTPLFFMGTGGLRRLPAAQQEALLSEVRKQLGQSGFRFESGWARVISGDDEGAFGWLALNYQQGRLRTHSHSAAAGAGRGAAAASITSLGALDLGGSSLQITFEVPPVVPSSGSGSSSTERGSAAAAAAAAAPPEYNISAAGHTFQLHLHSFKQYGLNEAYDRSISYLLQQQQQQEQQDNLEQEAQAAVQQLAQRAASTAAGNGTEAARSTAPPAKPALLHSSRANASSGGAPTGLVDGHPQDTAVGAAMQHDLAVARAAGVAAGDGADGTGAAAAGTPAMHTGGDTQPAADVEHQRQVDLATAAAAGFHRPLDLDAPEALSTIADTDLDSLELSSSSSSDERSAEQGLVPSSSAGGAPGLGSSTLQGSSSHAGVQPVAHSRSALPHGAEHWPDVQQDSSGGLASPGLRLQGRQQQTPAAARRRVSGQLRRLLMQQQLLWLGQVLGSAQQQQPSSSSSRSGFGASSTVTVMNVQQQHSYDIRLRQLLTEYLLRDDLGPPPSVVSEANITSTEGSHDDSLAAARHPGRASSSAAPPVAVQGGHAPLDGSSSNSSSKLQVVQHPCLHEGYEAVYTRLAFEGVTPDPAEVLLRGAPDWDSCVAVANAVVNASAPCAVHEHLPACVLGTPQPELQGNFMALTGFYVVSRFLGVQGRQTLDPLLDAAKTLCGRPWPWVQEHLGSHVNVERYCTWAPYVVHLLLHGLGLEEHHVVIAQDGDLGWPLGAVLVEASRLPGFSTASAPAAGSRQQRQHRKHGPRSKHSSLRGAASVLQQAEVKAEAAPTVADATPATAPAAGHLAPALQQHTASSQQAGPSWSLGLLHHNNHPHTGLHLSGPGWVVVLVVAWSIIVAWCRGVCGPKAAGPVAFLPLTGIVSTAGAGRAQVSGHIGRGKVSPIRSFKNASL